MKPLFLAFTLAALAWGEKPAPDTILRAMQDELDRSRTLRIEGLDDRPYYIEYALEDVDTFNAAASLGALISASRNRARVPQVQVRAGSYEFDNTDYVFSNRSSGARYDSSQWPLDDNYPALRRNLWLATDRVYKTAIEAIARKRSALKNAAAPETTPDFFKAEPAVAILPVSRIPFDEAAWKKRAVGMSGIFAGYPEIQSSSVEVSLFQGTSYFVNSEGSMQRTPDLLLQYRARAQAQAPDGMPLHDARVFQAIDADGLAPDAELRKGTTEVADTVRALLKAPVGEAYSGPVLFEARAAAQLLSQVLGNNLQLSRKPVSESGQQSRFMPSELESKLNSRILPDWMDVVDDATQSEWRGQKLLGFYQFDMDGMPPKPVQVVEKGVLKGFLLTRQGVKGFTASNGHARLAGNYGARSSAIGNLFVKASTTKPLPDLKKQLIEMCVQRNKPYGILVRKLDYPSTASRREMQSIATSLQASGGGRPVSPPVLVYRVYPDGREELVRGLRLRGLNVRSLRDIVAASDENFVFNFINNGAPFAYIGVDGFVAPTSVIAPSLLFEEIELEKPEDELSQPPLVPPPPIETAP